MEMLHSSLASSFSGQPNDIMLLNYSHTITRDICTSTYKYIIYKFCILTTVSSIKTNNPWKESVTFFP